jgi:hypothetical protein
MGSWALTLRFTYWSSVVSGSWSYPWYAANSEEYLAFVHPEDRAFMKQGIAKMLDDHLAFDFTNELCVLREIRH